jgi:pilus assembly protein Flp/PilA
LSFEVKDFLGIFCAGGSQLQPMQETTMKALIARFAKEESGATAIEYGLIATLIAVGIVTSETGLGSALNAKFTAISSVILNATH